PSTGGTGCMIASQHLQRSPLKLAGVGLLKIDDGGRARLSSLRKPFIRHITDGHDIGFALAFKISSDSGHGAVKRTDGMTFKGKLPSVLQPLKAVIRLEHIGLVENIAVDIEHI